MQAEADIETESGTEHGFKAQVRRQGVALLVLGALGAILLGFAIGTLVRLPLDGGSGEPDPTAVDVGFAQDMSAHHAQAVEMAGIALLRSTDNDVRRLAYDIMTTQQNQVGRMQGWLQLWNKPTQSVEGFMGWMSETGSEHGHGHGGGHQMSGSMASMPGMATQEELAAMRQAPAPEADVMFLRLMLRHHQGGMPMMEYAADHAATTAVRTLAASMAETQQAESRLLTTMLTARGGAPLPLN
ncbi:DUF305 domain-containing protein [Nocardia xishanensis]|uniref:DUF305 domain-containing protein n=1 Tax=Nocardia xishanensis TaxID=238964 RepID=UPI0009FD352C|nr:DUF305 domain-containing protein [Nocardia xishanensis]